MPLRLFNKKKRRKRPGRAKKQAAHEPYNDPRIHKMVERNNKGIAREKAGDITAAVRLYEANIRDRFDGTHPYNRLRIIYARQKRYDDAIRVCQAYLALPNRKHGQNKPHFQHHLAKLNAKVASKS